MKGAFEAMDALEKRGDRQPRRESHGRPLLAPRAGAGAAAGDRRRDPRHDRRRSRCSPARGPRRHDQARRRAGSRRCCRSASAARPSGPSSSPTPSATRAATRWRSISSTTPTPTAWPAMLPALDGKLPETLCLVISKSGGTPEPRNGMMLVADAYKTAGLEFAKHAVAVTRPGSHLDKQAAARRLAGAVPDVGLGRRPHQRAVGRRPGAGGAPRDRHRRPARRRRRLRRGHPRATTRRATPPPCWP